MNSHQVEPKALAKLREVLIKQNSHYKLESKSIQQMSDSDLVAYAAEELDRMNHFLHLA